MAIFKGPNLFQRVMRIIPFLSLLLIGMCLASVSRIALLIPLKAYLQDYKQILLVLLVLFVGTLIVYPFFRRNY